VMRGMPAAFSPSLHDGVDAAERDVLNFIS
jgi:hypothetical protein